MKITKMLALNFIRFSEPKLNSENLVSAPGLSAEVDLGKHYFGRISPTFDGQPREITRNRHCNDLSTCQLLRLKHSNFVQCDLWFSFFTFVLPL